MQKTSTDLNVCGPEADRDRLLAALFRDKPEMVVNFPDWMLSAAEQAAYRRMANLAIVEIAGRDSVAAAIRAVDEYGFTDLLPVYAYTGSEYGPWASVIEAVNRLRRSLPQARVHPLLALGSPEFWRALNGRFVSDLIACFGHYTPCPGCHLYLHAVRIPLSRMLGSRPIIAGERESHSGLIKANQTGEVLDFYVKVLQQFGIQLLLPLRKIVESREIEDILGMAWQRGKDQLGCCLAGNYKGDQGQVRVPPQEVMRFLTEFAGPLTDWIIRGYMENKVPDHMAGAGEIITACISTK